MINDMGRHRYFRRHYTKDMTADRFAVVKQFLLFDRSGKLVY